MNRQRMVRFGVGLCDSSLILEGGRVFDTNGTRIIQDLAINQIAEGGKVSDTFQRP